MRILVLGGDGYLGWPTCMDLAAKGHEVLAADNYLRRWICLETNSRPPVRTPDPGPSGRTLQGGLRPGHRLPHWGSARLRLHPLPGGGIQARHHRPLCGAAFGPLLHAGRIQGAAHPDEQYRGHLQRHLGGEGMRARVPHHQARHHGRVRYAEHRHRGRLHRP